ncbi:MAG: inorganic phosphate transporter [candidate division Zixibacteria bacterium]
MGIEFFLGIVILLGCFTVFNLVVGVSNDAANFLNSSIGSRVAPRHIIMIIASLGILAGVTFSGGMMEVARKGIFHPHLFTMPELTFIFLAVILTNILLLDLFNTYGLPTSTTVSIVFELLGAAVAASVIKILNAGNDISTVIDYINTSKAAAIIFGILFSVAVAFICGTIAQFLSRLLFTFDYMKRIRRYGAIWGSIALSMITYFILVKGAKGSSIISPENAQWIISHTFQIFIIIIPILALILQVLLMMKINIFKPIVLMGTFALAMAFAANDLVNFIGVPMAGFHAYQAATSSDAPLTVTMDALGKKVPTETYLLLVAGFVMVVTLWISRKARTVTETEISLGQQDEGEERFDSSFMSRFIVTSIRSFFDVIEKYTPGRIQSWFTNRFSPQNYDTETDQENRPKFDLLRASVNLMVASAVISYATSQKLPLSTTYVTFMVAMGASFADRAWGRESAVYRVTGMLTVIGGWFTTALLAFTISACFTVIIFYGEAIGIFALLIIGALIIRKNRKVHIKRRESLAGDDIFNLKKVTDLSDTIYTTFEHMSHLIRILRDSLDKALEGLFLQNKHILGEEKNKSNKLQRWSKIITANIFKAMRLMQKEDMQVSYKYGQTIRRLQKLVDGHRDIVMRSHDHINNHHKGLLDVQVEELRQVKAILIDILSEVELIISRRQLEKTDKIEAKAKELRQLAQRFHEVQLERIRNGESKTRLNILYYSIIGNAMMLTKQNLKLLEIYNESFGQVDQLTEFDLD